MTSLFLALSGCSGMMQFVYYEPQANGWKLRHVASSEPDDEVIFRIGDNAVTVSAMTLSANLRSVGPPFLPVVPVDESNNQPDHINPHTLSIYVRLFLREPAIVDFSGITLTRNNQKISMRAVYRLSVSTLGNKKITNMSETVSSATEYERTHGQFPHFQLVFPLLGEKPDEFSVEIPSNAIRINGESVPATIIHFRKKTTSKYQYFP